MKRPDNKTLDRMLLPVIAVFLALLAGSILILIDGHSPVEAYGVLFSSVFGKKVNFGEAVAKAIPIAFTGFSVTFAYRCGIFNIGAEGQLLMGALGSVWTALAFPGMSPSLIITVSILTGTCFGAAWAFLPALVKAFRGINEVLTTILMNYIALFLISWLINGPLQEKARQNPQTDAILKSYHLPVLVSGTRIHLGLILLLVLGIGIFYYLFYTAPGFKTRMMGQNQEAAAYSGINIPRSIISSIMISGAIAGMGGAVEMMGIQFRMVYGFGRGYGFDGISMALIGQLHPFGVLLTSLLFGILRTGANSMQRLVGIPTSVVDIIQALIIFFVIGAGSVRILSRFKIPAKRRNDPHD
jgi:simple sugar transport system permease protein